MLRAKFTEIVWMSRAVPGRRGGETWEWRKACRGLVTAGIVHVYMTTCIMTVLTCMIL